MIWGGGLGTPIEFCSIDFFLQFDHGDGMIDWREFMVALRPDWEERGPLTDTQRIDDEIKRQVAQCTCRQKFKVFQVGEGKYRVSGL